MKIAYAILLLATQFPLTANAIEVNVRYEKKVYYLHAEFEVHASPATVMNILTDFNNIAELNPAIIESKILAPENTLPDVVRVLTVIKDCIFLFCRHITRVQDIQQQGNKRLDSVIIPEESDLRSGNSMWTLVESSMGTKVQYISDMQFKFWVPPLIRSNSVAKKFKLRVTQTAERLQRLAENK